MGLFLLGLLLYCLVLLAESALVALSPQETEQLRSDSSGSSQRVYALARDIRPAMATLLLARILLKLLLVVFPAAWCVQSPFVRANLYQLSQQLGISGAVVWILAALLLALAFAGLFRAIMLVNFQRLVSGRVTVVLRLLGIYILFWKKLFSPFVRVEKPAGTGEDEPSPSDLAATNAVVRCPAPRAGVLYAGAARLTGGAPRRGGHQRTTPVRRMQAA